MYFLPEPIEYLIRNKKVPEAKKILHKIDPTISLSANTELVLNSNNRSNSSTPIKALFENKQAFSTILFWITFFMSLLLVYALGNWIPKLMLEQGFNLSTSLAFLFSLNIGAMFGAIFGGILADKFSPKKVLAAFFLTGALALYLLSFKSHISIIYLLVAIAGACSIGAQIIVCAFAAQFYPTAIRATGVGWGLGVGRLGAITGPMIIGWVLSLNFPLQYNFIILAIPCLIAFVSVLLINTKLHHNA